MDLVPVGLVVPLHAVAGHVGEIVGIGGAPQADVGVHALHDGPVEAAPGLELFLAGVADELPAQFLVVVVPERHAAPQCGEADEFLAQRQRVQSKWLVPLPEGASYLGFMFARAPSAAQAESALREAHAKLRIVTAPVMHLQDGR